jgi:hypothetical protein
MGGGGGGGQQRARGACVTKIHYALLLCRDRCGLIFLKTLGLPRSINWRRGLLAVAVSHCHSCLRARGIGYTREFHGARDRLFVLFLPFVVYRVVPTIPSLTIQMRKRYLKGCGLHCTYLP